MSAECRRYENGGTADADEMGSGERNPSPGDQGPWRASYAPPVGSRVEPLPLATFCAFYFSISVIMIDRLLTFISINTCTRCSRKSLAHHNFATASHRVTLFLPKCS